MLWEDMSETLVGTRPNMSSGAPLAQSDNPDTQNAPNIQPGNSQNLVVVVSAYRPIVTCFGSVGAARTMSQALIDAIPTDYTLQRFARLGVRAVDVVLPRTYYDPWAERPPYRFYVKIDTVAYTPVTGRWFDIWAATVAINALCVRNGRAGRARTEAGLVVRLDRKYESPGEVVSEGFNGSSSIIDAASS